MNVSELGGIHRGEVILLAFLLFLPHFLWFYFRECQLTGLIAAMDGLLEETSSFKYVWIHFHCLCYGLRGYKIIWPTPPTKQSQQRPDYLMVLNSILPDFPVMWGMLGVILPSPVCSKGDQGHSDLKLDVRTFSFYSQKFCCVHCHMDGIQNNEETRWLKAEAPQMRLFDCEDLSLLPTCPITSFGSQHWLLVVGICECLVSVILLRTTQRSIMKPIILIVSSHKLRPKSLTSVSIMEIHHSSTQFYTLTDPHSSNKHRNPVQVV